MDANQVFRAALQRFTRAPHLPGPELKRLQDAKLCRLLGHVVEHVPFYRDLYRERGVSVDAIAGAEDLWRLPSVIKSDYLRCSVTDDLRGGPSPSWERQSPDWRFARRQSGDWRSQGRSINPRVTER